MRQRDIFWFWLPLFASWLLMTAEGPIISAAINRLPDQVIMLAAQGIVISLSVTIESPIINLLATSTALVKDHASYRLVRRFTIHWMVFLTLVTILVAFTPLFDVIVRQWLDVPEPVAIWVQPGMKIMTFWSAAIAWRRFLQGLLIRFNRPRQMAWGTAVRLLASGGTVIGLAIWTDLPGVINGATALMVGVIAEAIYATVAVQPILRQELSEERPQTSDLTYSILFWFHLPLAATSLLVLLAQPLVTFSLARLDQPTESLAAWPVLFQIMLMARAAALALPEAVIALSQGRHTFAPIRRFSFYLAGGLTIFMILLIFTPLSNFYVFTVQEMTPLTGQLTLSGLLLFLPFPALATITSWLRGLLINEQATKGVNMGMAINLLLTAVVLAIGLQQRLPGLPTAAVALNIAAFGEIIYLAWRTQRTLPLGLSLWGNSRPVACQAAD
jgi:progressive ankylosis protein